MTKQELEYALKCANYDKEVYKLREEITTMVNRCTSLDTLKKLKEDMQDTYNEYLDRWKHVAAMGNIQDMVKKLSDEYKVDILKYIHICAYDIAVEHCCVDYDKLFYLDIMEKTDKRYSPKKEGVA